MWMHLQHIYINLFMYHLVYYSNLGLPIDFVKFKCGTCSKYLLSQVILSSTRGREGALEQNKHRRHFWSRTSTALEQN